MSDTIVVMKDGTIQQIGDPKTIYDEPANAFVADFIGESNLLRGTMIHDELVEFAGTEFPCVDFGFGENTPVYPVVTKGTYEDVVNSYQYLSDGDKALIIENLTSLFAYGEDLTVRIIPSAEVKNFKMYAYFTYLDLMFKTAAEGGKREADAQRHIDPRLGEQNRGDPQTRIKAAQ